MRAVLHILIVLALLMFGQVAWADCDECQTDTFAFHYITKDPDEAKHMEMYFWEVLSYREHVDEVFGTVCQVTVKLIDEDHPLLPTVDLTWNDLLEKIYFGDWTTFTAAEERIAESGCAVPVS